MCRQRTRVSLHRVSQLHRQDLLCTRWRDAGQVGLPNLVVPSTWCKLLMTYCRRRWLDKIGHTDTIETTGVRHHVDRTVAQDEATGTHLTKQFRSRQTLLRLLYPHSLDGVTISSGFVWPDWPSDLNFAHFGTNFDDNIVTSLRPADTTCYSLTFLLFSVTC